MPENWNAVVVDPIQENDNTAEEFLANKYVITGLNYNNNKSDVEHTGLLSTSRADSFPKGLLTHSVVGAFNRKITRIQPSTIESIQLS